MVHRRTSWHISYVHYLPRCQLRTEPVCAPVQVIARQELERQPLVRRTLDHLPAQLHLGLEGALGRNLSLCPSLGIRLTEPSFRQEQLTIYLVPGRPLPQHQEDAYLAYVRLAQAPVVLPGAPRGMLARFRLGTFIQHQDVAVLQPRRRLDFFSHLLDGSTRPSGRLRHEVLRVLSPRPGFTTDLSEVPVSLHTQQATQVAICMFRDIARLRPKHVSVAPPKGSQPLRQRFHGVEGQCPTHQILQFLSSADSVICSSIPHLQNCVGVH